MTKHNPGVPTRAMAMMNGSIYDAFQAVNRTHEPFKVNTFAPGASVDAAVSQAAYRVLSDMYPEDQGDVGQHSGDAAGCSSERGRENRGHQSRESHLPNNTLLPTRTMAGICPTRTRRPWDLATGARTQWSAPPGYKKGGEQIGVRCILGPCQIPILSMRRLLSHCGHEYAAVYRCV